MDLDGTGQVPSPSPPHTPAPVLLESEVKFGASNKLLFCVPTRIIIPSAIPAYLQVHTVRQDVVVRKVVASYLFLTDPIPFNFVIVPVYRALTGVSWCIIYFRLL